MRMPVEEEVHISRRDIGGNVDQMNPKGRPGKIQRQRTIHPRVAIAPDDLEWLAPQAQLVQYPFAANIPQVPNLIGIGDLFGQRVRKLVVGVRDDSDASRLLGRGRRAVQALILVRTFHFFQQPIFIHG